MIHKVRLNYNKTLFAKKSSNDTDPDKIRIYLGL
jgi:hypothetical protein